MFESILTPFGANFIFCDSWDRSENWIELKIEPTLANLVCLNQWNTQYLFCLLNTSRINWKKALEKCCWNNLCYRKAHIACLKWEREKKTYDLRNAYQLDNSKRLILVLWPKQTFISFWHIRFKIIVLLYLWINNNTEKLSKKVIIR